MLWLNYMYRDYKEIFSTTLNNITLFTKAFPAINIKEKV